MEILVLNIYLNPFKDDEETWNWGEILTDLLRRMDLLHTISKKKTQNSLRNLSRTIRNLIFYFSSATLRSQEER